METSAVVCLFIQTNKTKRSNGACFIDHAAYHIDAEDEHNLKLQLYPLRVGQGVETRRCP